MDVRAFRRDLLPGLVALLMLAAAVVSAQQGGPAAEGPVRREAAGELELRGWDEISRAGHPRAYRNPAWLLLLVPGTLFFGYALLGRLAPKRLPFLLVLPLLIGAGAGSPEQLVREAEGLFRAGQYGPALERYREAGALLPANPALLYDLGLAAHRAGERGYAVFYTRRAVEEDPLDPVLRRALKYLEDSYGLEGQVPLPLPVPADLPFFLSIGFANLTLFMAGFVVRRGRVQFLIALVLAAVFAAGALGVFLARLHGQARSVGVLAGESRMLRIPEPDSRTWLELPAGTTLWVRGSAAGYALVETGSRLKGWVAEQRILLD